jgi:diguanylate cyclase (GGDEF)-like protein
MASAGFILAINLFIAALFALAFFLVKVNNRSDRVAGWFALAYVFGILYIGCEFVLPADEMPQLTYTLGFAAFFGALAAVAVGIARRYRRPAPWVLLGVMAAVSIALNFVLFPIGRDSLVRMFAYQAPYAALQALAGWFVLRSGRRQPIDHGLAALFAVSTLQFLSKPFVAQLTGGPGDSAASYIASTYALYSQSLGAVLQVATGLLMLMLLVRDMLVEVTARSETDLLSGLYNRRGFEDRVQSGLAAALRDGVPGSLVAADLDAFKGVNDNFGHAAGDAVIETFARLLRDAAPNSAIVGRTGGEEFSVYLPGTNLSAARLFAEGVRAGFAALEIDGLPAGHRCTASFGVAETGGLESLSDLRRRADAALYAAKRGGRDRVCLATEADPDSMPAHPFAMADRRGEPRRLTLRGL